MTRFYKYRKGYRGQDSEGVPFNDDSPDEDQIKYRSKEDYEKWKKRQDERFVP